MPYHQKYHQSIANHSQEGSPHGLKTGAFELEPRIKRGVRPAALNL